MARVLLKNLVKNFDEVTAVKDLNLEIEDRGFVVLVGPSGCGKTTVLRIIAGLESPTEGDVYIDDTRVNEVSPKDRDVGMVFQNYALFPHLNVYENMAFGLRLRKFPKEEIEKRVHEAANLLGIADLLRRKPGQLSGGQRQRVAVGRAIARKPRVYLFDEPLSNLDAKMRVQMRAEFEKLHERTETTFVYVTHDQVEAMTLADRIVVMKDGELQQSGEPFELFERPVNMFVAGFIGSPSINFIPLKVAGGDSGLRLQGGSLDIECPADLEEGLMPYKGKEVVLGIRPEHVYTSPPAGRDSQRPDLRAEVEVCEPTGTNVYLFLVSDSFRFVSVVSAKRRPRPHDRVDVWFDMGEMHFFDPATEKAILSPG
ncbi:MAG: ABC transporter ATP-binding protein [Deltaproteobacteria bacterium]|nr:ABC transporter ATP-binding protein [Deltaproteobacteria bacterium]